MPDPVVSHGQKRHKGPHFDYLDLRSVVPDPVVSHAQARHKGPHFDYLNLRSAVVLCTIFLVFLDAVT